MDLSSFKNIQRLFSHRSKIRYAKNPIHPDRDWLIGLGCFLLFVSIGGGVSLEQFVTYKYISSDASAEAVSEVTFNEKRASFVREVYTKKQAQFMALTQSNALVETPPITAPATTTAGSTTPSSVLEGTITVPVAGAGAPMLAN